MKRNKLVYFDSKSIDTQVLESKLKEIRCEYYIVTEDLMLVVFDGTPKDLYETLLDIVDRYNIFIIDIVDSLDSYWGYMSKNLWEWLKSNSVSE